MKHKYSDYESGRYPSKMDVRPLMLVRHDNHAVHQIFTYHDDQ